MCVCKFCCRGRLLKNHWLVDSASFGVQRLAGILPLHFNGIIVFVVVCILCFPFLIYYRTVTLSHCLARVTGKSHGAMTALIVIRQGSHTLCTCFTHTQNQSRHNALSFLKLGADYFTGSQRHERL